VVAHQLELDHALGAAKLRPAAHRQAQINRGRIETGQFVLEMELAFALRLGGDRLEQTVGDLFEQILWTVAVRVRQRGADWGGDPQVDQLAFAALQLARNLLQRMHSTELTEPHPHKLTPVRQPRAAIFGPCTLDDALEVGARDELGYLTRHAA